MEVFESLPEVFYIAIKSFLSCFVQNFRCTFRLQVLKDCFEKQNIELLQQAIATLPEEEARYHMKRCVESGLWVPEGNTSTKE